jgi:two-component system, NtrC family, sensor kinase
METRGTTKFFTRREKQADITAIAFLFVAILIVLDYLFDFPALITGNAEITIWLRPALAAALVLLVGAAATSVIVRLNKEQANAKRELALKAHILDAATDSIFANHPDGSIIYANKQGYTTLGYTEEEILKLNQKDFLKEEDRARFDPWVKRRIEKGEGVAETEHIKKDGRLIPIEVRARCFELDDEKIIISVCRDITRRKKVEAAIKANEQRLKGSEKKFRDLFENLPVGIVVSALDGQVKEVNRALMLMHRNETKEEFIKTPQSERFCNMKDREKWITLVQEKGRVDDYEVRTRRKDGSIFWSALTSIPTTGADGEQQLITVSQDVTDRKEMAQQLIMADRLASIGELVAGIAHELNNPLTTVIGFSQLLVEQIPDDDSREELKIVNNEAQRAAKIVKNLLTFGRKHAPTKQECQINTIIEEVLQLRAYEHKVNNIEVIADLSPELPETLCDHFQLQQVFLNLVINAEFFMIEENGHGTLTIKTEVDENVIRISIKDDGPGIPPENLLKIFDPFFTTKDVGKGTGLGLSICHGIVSEHGGTIKANSQPGQGAEFVIELPLVPVGAGVG